MATLGLNEAEKAAVEAFRQEVVEPSRTSLIVLDFWAEWCGPCKQLTPVLEKVAADYATKGVKLVKVNVDEQGFIASQFRVQSIPTVYAIFQGQPVADLTNARTEGQLKGMLDQILAQLPIQSEEGAMAAELEPLLAMGEEVLASGEHERALSVYGQILDMAPGNGPATAGLARALAAMGHVEEAEAALESLEPDQAKDPAVTQARAAVSLAKDVKPVSDLSALEAKVAADPDDMQAGFDLASGQMGNGDRQAAADTLLALIAKDKAWNDGAAKAQLLKLFEAVGLEDPWVSAQRRRLSAILFG